MNRERFHIRSHGIIPIKKVGIQSRTDIEEFVGKKVFLDLNVKVDKDWRDNEEELRHFGYEA